MKTLLKGDNKYDDDDDDNDDDKLIYTANQRTGMTCRRKQENKREYILKQNVCRIRHVSLNW
jgi:hypothetical protein